MKEQADPAVRAIEARLREGEPIDFDWLRKRFARENGIKNSLDWGTAVLDSTDQLNQYLWTYGLMVKCQWQHATARMPSMPRPFRLIDYGCGQGLAGLLLRDLRPGDFANVQEILLIEPSPAALARAEAVYRHLAPRIDLGLVCVGFDELVEGEPVVGLDTLHLFSNVLDVPGFDAPALLTKAWHPGRNVVVAVSPDRDFDGGTPRLLDLQRRVDRGGREAQLRVVRNDLTTFPLDNPKNAASVLWLCEVDVRV